MNWDGFIIMSLIIMVSLRSSMLLIALIYAQLMPPNMTTASREGLNRFSWLSSLSR